MAVHRNYLYSHIRKVNYYHNIEVELKVAVANTNFIVCLNTAPANKKECKHKQTKKSPNCVCSPNPA